MGNYTVYAHIVPNSKMYIGITKQDVSRRWRNGRGYVHNDYFNNAINKYGWDNIEHFIIASGITKEEAIHFEILLIDKLEINNREFGYNLTDGGEGATGSKCPQWKKDMLSEIMSGKGNPMYGISLEGMKGEDNPMYGKPALNRRKVQCITTGVVFDTITDGAKHYGTYRSDISKSINGKRNYAGKFNGEPLVWRYLNEN